MGLFEIIINNVVTFVFGALFVILVELYLLKKYLYSGPAANQSKCPLPLGKVELPEDLLSEIDRKENFSFNNPSPRHCFTQGNKNAAINLTLQFLFRELKDAERVRLWFFKKLNAEFKELINQSSTGRFFESAQLRDLNLGNSFPIIKALDVADSKICEETGLLETLDLSLDLEYSGNFQMAVDLKMVLGKTASISVQVRKLMGRARLQFTRTPYTHWSLSFYTEPVLELEVQSQFQGRQLQPKIISLITGQIRRAIRRKHMLPRYKIRYKPFFRRLNDEDINLPEDEIPEFSPGHLDITLIEVSRLNLTPSTLGVENFSDIEVYCTMHIDSMACLYYTEYSGISYMVLDLVVSKGGSEQLGVVFKQETVEEIGQNCIIINNVVPGGLAEEAGMRKGDIILAVNGKPISNMNQIPKFIKISGQTKFTLRIERKFISVINNQKKDIDKSSEKSFSSFEIADEPFKSVKFSDLKDMEKSLEKVSSDSLFVEDSSKSVSELKDSEIDSVYSKSEGSKLFRRKKNSSTNSLGDDITEQASVSLSKQLLSNYGSDSGFSNTKVKPENTEFSYTTNKKDFKVVIAYEEKNSFYINSDLQYLNIGVWAKIKNYEKLSKLVGYVNIPIKLILNRCYTSTIGHYYKCHPLLPPDLGSVVTNSNLEGYSGFDPMLCFGDILLSYMWISDGTKQTSTQELSNKKYIDDAVTSKPQPFINYHDVSNKKHEFIKTTLTAATNCDCCSKKIWLKAAFQCRNCGIVCHKKCEIRCQTDMPCGASEAQSLCSTIIDGPEDLNSRFSVSESNPEISLTGCEEKQVLDIH